MLLGCLYVPLEWVLLFSSSTDNGNIDDLHFFVFIISVPADPKAVVRTPAQKVQSYTESCGDVGSVYP